MTKGKGLASAVVPGRVRACAVYPARRPEALLVLQFGGNPTTDYYLRPRLDGTGLPWRIANLDEDPAGVLAALPGALWVVLVRYANRRWLDALEAARPRLARVSLMLDDDIAAMMADPDLPLAYRAHVFVQHGRWARRLSRLASETWASTPVLAERYGADAVLDPVPEADPPPPRADAPPLVVYPGSASHARETAFVREVARRVLATAPQARFEVTGPARSSDPANLACVAEAAWPLWRAAQAGRSAALCLAPLFPSAVNAARAPVKAFDAARLGAAGLYADAAPFAGFVRHGEDGLVLPMDVEAWARAIAELLADPPRRLALASAAAARLARLRRDPSLLPARAT